MITPDNYAHWLAVARRHAWRADEAADLLHNALITAIAAGRQDLTDAANAAWFVGVIRNTALMEARSAGRRKRREVGQAPIEQAKASSNDEVEAWLAAVSLLPRGARSVAVLALHGLNRKEIASILGLNDASLRQRLTSVRKAMIKLDPAARPADLPNLRSTIRTRLELGLLRRALLSVLLREGDLGTHDPDGHLIVLSKKSSHNRVPRQHE